MAAVAPLAVDLPASNPDSSVTSLAASMGAGSYAYVARGCEGDVLSKKQYYYRDAGFAVEHQFRGPVAVGLRSKVVRELPGFPENTMVWNPYVSAEWRKFGLGAGYVPRGETLVSGSGTDVPPASAHLRAGAFDRMYFSIHLWEDVPAISGGGGMVRFGLGFRPGRRLDLWTGLGSVEPYDKAGFVLKADVHLARAIDLNLSGRLGGSEGLVENAGSIGVKFKWIHGSRPLPPPAPASAVPTESLPPPAPAESLPPPAPPDSSAAPR